METWQLARGSGGTWVVTIRDSLGQAVTSYTGGEPLDGRVWRGNDRATSFTLSPGWIDAGSGTVSVTIPKADTAALDRGQYRIQLLVLDGLTDPVFHEGILEITSSPGTAGDLPVYCTLDDLLEFCSWLQNQSDIEHDEAGFLRQRHRARQWLDRAILMAHRPQHGWGSSTFGNTVFGHGPARTPGLSKDLLGHLAADRLMTAPPRPVAEMTARHAIGLVLQDQITSGGGGPRGNPYASIALDYLAQAANLLITYVAEVDTDGDGFPEYSIPCGTVGVLRG